MARRDIGTDDPRVKVRAAKSKPRRSKLRVDHSDCPVGFVYAVDRGRYRVRVQGEQSVDVTAVKARELGKGGIIVGDYVRVAGDISGRKDTLARIVEVCPRASLLRRSTEDTPDAAEKPMVANAQVLCIVAACADPVPRPGMVDRCLAAAYTEGLESVLILTKSDLVSPEPMRALFEPLGVRVLVTAITPAGEVRGLEELRAVLAGKVSVLVGHSGVGKSTLMNHLIPEAERATGQVNAVTGRGRHTSTASLALPFAGGWLIDTPGIRSFGLAHLDGDDLLAAFPDLWELSADCPKLCTHLEEAPGCVLPAEERRTQSLRRLLLQVGKQKW